MRVSHVFSVTDPSARSSTLLATHLRSMLTCSTGYQRPQPRTITRSCPFHLLMATTGPMGQLTRVLPRKACSTRAALIWRTLVECIDSSFQDALLRNAPPLSLPLHSGLLGRSGAGCGEHKQPLIGSRRAEEGVEIDQEIRRERGSASGMVGVNPFCRTRGKSTSRH